MNPPIADDIDFLKERVITFAATTWAPAGREVLRQCRPDDRRMLGDADPACDAQSRRPRVKSGIDG
jgi:hypothetical protein